MLCRQPGHAAAPGPIGAWYAITRGSKDRPRRAKPTASRRHADGHRRGQAGLNGADRPGLAPGAKAADCSDPGHDTAAPFDGEPGDCGRRADRERCPRHRPRGRAFHRARREVSGPDGAVDRPLKRCVHASRPASTGGQDDGASIPPPPFRVCHRGQSGPWTARRHPRRLRAMR